MKYFVEQVRPVGRYWTGLFAGIKFERYQMLEVSEKFAYKLYMESHRWKHLEEHEVDKAYLDGDRVYCDENSLVIVGLDISDKDIFQMKLEGKVKEGVMEYHRTDIDMSGVTK